VLTRRRIKELDRLRELGLLQVERWTRETQAILRGGVSNALPDLKSGAVQFDRVARAIRQVMVLEFELRGLFKAPDRDAPPKLRLVKSDRPGFEPPETEHPEKPFADAEPFDLFDVRMDYHRGPMDQVIAGIRRTLGAEAPEDDPFAAPPERGVAPPPQPRPPQPKPPQPKEPGMRVRTEPDKAKPAPTQKTQAVKAAVLAIKSTGGKSFRIPPAKPGKSRKSKHRQGRGPPR
jgi:hypothetical protein